MVWMARLY
jgi:hypothetical protein